MGTTIKPTSKGQITLRKGVLEHMDLHPGEVLEVFLLPNRKVQLEPVRPKKDIASLFGILGPSKVGSLTTEQINEGIAQGAVDSYLRSIGELPDDEDEPAR